jgi:uncharacterized membrane protein
MNWFLIAFLSAVFSAASAISEKKILFDLDALEFSFSVSIITLVLSVPFFLGINFAALPVMNLLILFFKSILGALAFLCIMQALKNMEISGALPLMVLTPGLVAIFAFIFIGDKLSQREIAGMILLLVGTYALEMKAKQAFLEPFRIFTRSKYYHYIGFALALFTVSSILDRLLLNRFKLPPFTFMAFQQFFFAIIFAVIFFFSKTKNLEKVKSFDKKIWLWILLISVLTVGYRYTQIEAVKIAPVALVLSVKRISVFIAAVAGGKIFKEKSLLKKTIATAIMVVGAILIMRD